MCQNYSTTIVNLCWNDKSKTITVCSCSWFTLCMSNLSNFTEWFISRWNLWIFVSVPSTLGEICSLSCILWTPPMVLTLHYANGMLLKMLEPIFAQKIDCFKCCAGIFSTCGYVEIVFNGFWLPKFYFYPESHVPYTHIHTTIHYLSNCHE